MHYERLVFWIPGCGCFQATDIGAVTQLGLCITSDDFVVLGLSEKEFVLLWCALFS